MKKPETPEEQWEAVVRFARSRDPEDDDEDNAEPNGKGAKEPTTEAEVDASLRALGYDVEKVNRESEAFVEKMMATLHDEEVRHASAEGTEPPRPAPSAPTVARAVPAEAEVIRLEPREDRARGARFAMALLVAALIATLLLCGGAFVAFLEQKPAPIEPDRPTPRAPPRHESSPEEMAAKLRRDAKEACGRHDWKACTRRLDDAARMDPAGEQSEEVKALRQQLVDVPPERDKGSGSRG